jgi:nucleotide-binding universal stress UspA family protein
MKILVATDGTDFSRAAVDKCCEIANQLTSAEIKVISVYEPRHSIAAEPFAVSAEFYANMDKLSKEQADEWINDALKIMRAKCGEAKVEFSGVVELGKPSQAIVETASSWDADLIVMGSHGRGFLERLTLGSVSNAVVHQAPCSVLIVKAAQTARATTA